MSHSPLSLLAASAALALAGPPRADAGVVFAAQSQGTFENETGTVVGVEIVQAFSSSSPFPLATGGLSLQLDTVPDVFVIVGGGFVLTAPGGDQLFGTVTGTVTPVSETDLLLDAPFLFTGGTGQFQGASGGGTITGAGVFTSQTTGDASLTWAGTLAVGPAGPAAVPAPGGLALLLAGGGAAAALRPRRRPGV